MLETKTPEAIPQRCSPSLWQTYPYNFRRLDRPDLNPGASNPVLNLPRDHAPLSVRTFSSPE